MALFRGVWGPGGRRTGRDTVYCDFGPFDVGLRLSEWGVRGELECGGQDGIDMGCGREE